MFWQYEERGEGQYSYLTPSFRCSYDWRPVHTVMPQDSGECVVNNLHNALFDLLEFANDEWRRSANTPRREDILKKANQPQNPKDFAYSSSVSHVYIVYRVLDLLPFSFDGTRGWDMCLTSLGSDGSFTHIIKLRPYAGRYTRR
jgi:hypothetical protein